MTDLTTRLVRHILALKKADVDYARHALVFYDKKLPHLNLKEAVKNELNRQTAVAGPQTQPEP